MRFGSHVSIRDGYFEAAKTAHKMGAEAFQFFPKNPRSLKYKDHSREDAKRCAAFCKEHDIVSIAHAPYPTKLAPEDSESRQAVEESLLNDLEIVEDCGAVGLVVHFGTARDDTDDPLERYKRMIQLLNNVLCKWSGNAMLLIENNAGKSGRMGTTLEELVKVRELTDHPEQIGFCLDTCHAYASGLWTGDNWNELKENGETLGYFDQLKAVHLNNSKYESGSMRDRHANIHNGVIPVEQMKEVMSSEVLQDIPMILETPSTDAYTHKDEIAYLNNLFA